MLQKRANRFIDNPVPVEAPIVNKGKSKDAHPEVSRCGMDHLGREWFRVTQNNQTIGLLGKSYEGLVSDCKWVVNDFTTDPPGGSILSRQEIIGCLLELNKDFFSRAKSCCLRHLKPGDLFVVTEMRRDDVVEQMTWNGRTIDNPENRRQLLDQTRYWALWRTVSIESCRGGLRYAIPHTTIELVGEQDAATVVINRPLSINVERLNRQEL